MINNRNTGPTPLPPSVLTAMSQQPLSHRSSAFREAFTDVTNKLAKLVNASEPPLLLSCSGTGGLEASIASIVSDKSKVLVLTAGSYGDLLARIAGRFTTHLNIVNFTLGESFNLSILQTQLIQTEYDAVLLTHSESSTGIYHPVAEVINFIRQYSDALILVDTISSLGATPIDMAAWEADVIVGATQKALMAPAGLAVIYLSARAQSYVERCPKYHDYMHLFPWLKASRQNCVPYTPAVNVFQGLHEAIALIFAEGLSVRYQRHQEASHRCRAFFSDNENTRCFAPTQYASHSITALYLSNSLSASVIKKRLEDEHRIIVSTGLGHLTERVIRIGHMGYFTLAEIDEALKATAQLIEQEASFYEN